MKRLAVLVGLCGLLFLGGISAFAQNVNGSIVGTVRDASGAVVPNASITITNKQTNSTFKTQSGTDGEFVLPNLAPGIYDVAVEASGFQTQNLVSLTVLANRASRIEPVMQPGVVTQRVEVIASAPVVNADSATIGNVMESQIITNVPLNGRTLDRLLRISAGVTTDSANNPRIAGSAYWGGTHFNVDGASLYDVGNGGAAYSFRNGLVTAPSVDAVSEFKLDSNSQKAEFEGSASVTIVTKSGSNQFHGSLFEFNRNAAYAAKNWAVTGLPKPAYNRNEFGVTAGGPVRRDKTFFFASYEGLRERFARTNANLSVATAAMRAGDFTGLPPILDPLTGQPFSNNRIPNDRIDPRARALIDYVPLPTHAGTGPAGTLQNYSVTIPQISDINRYSVRLDNRFSDRDTLWGNLNYSKGSPYFVAQGTPPQYGHWEDAGYETGGLNLTHNHTFSAATLNEFRFGYLYHGSVRRGMNTDFNPQSLFPQLYGPLPIGGLPVMAIGNHVAIGDYGGSPRGKQYTVQYIDNLTHVHGKHTLKAGVDIANYRNSTPPGAFAMGTGLGGDAAFGRFVFNGRFTNNTTGAAQPAHAFADFLLGYPTSTARATPSAISLFYQTRYSAYVQDDWRATSRLTLYFGLRYMVQTTWKERDGAIANFDFNTGRLVIGSDSLPPQAQPRLVSAYPIELRPGWDPFLPDRNNFAPRFGFAFRPFADGRTVIRGGIGMYYNTLPLYIGFRQTGFTNPPFLLSESYESAAGARPSLTLANPFPGSGAVAANPNVTGVERNIKNSLSQQWNLTLEREIMRNFGVRASYVGNKTSHLPWYNREMNLPSTQVAGNVQPRRPFQPWASVAILSGGGDSSMHQLQLEAIKRYSHGLTLQVEYSWNRSLDNVPVVGGTQNPYNASADRGNSDQIRRHIFTAAYSYELPFGPGKPFLQVSGPARHIIGGWELSGITYLRTGVPFSVTFTNSTQGWLATRADLVGDPTLSRGERSILRWFDPAAFRVPTPFTYGNSARNLLFAPGDIVFDISILKNTRITERITTQFRAEFFNMPNHPNFGGPGANISVPTSVGRIFSAGDPRQIQFGLKVLF